MNRLWAAVVVVLVSISLIASPGCGPGGFGQGGAGGGNYQTELMELDRLEKDLARITKRESQAVDDFMGRTGLPESEKDKAQNEAKSLMLKRNNLEKQVEAQRERVEKMRANRR